MNFSFPTFNPNEVSSNFSTQAMEAVCNLTSVESVSTSVSTYAGNSSIDWSRQASTLAKFLAVWATQNSSFLWFNLPGAEAASTRTDNAPHTTGDAPQTTEYTPQTERQSSAYQRALDMGKSEYTALMIARIVAMNEHIEPLRARLDQPDDMNADGGIARIKALILDFDMGLLAKDCYNIESIPESLPPGYSRVADTDLENVGLQPSDLRDNEHGYHAVLYKDDKDNYVLANRGTIGGLDAQKDWLANVLQSLGQSTPRYQHAVETASKLKAALPGKNIILVGHSLGGSLASAQSHKTGLSATVFNSAGLHSNTVKSTNADERRVSPDSNAPAADSMDAGEPIVSYHVSGEVLSFMLDYVMPVLASTLRITNTMEGPIRTAVWSFVQQVLAEVLAGIPSAVGRRHALDGVYPPTQSGETFIQGARMDMSGTAANTLKLHTMDYLLSSLCHKILQQFKELNSDKAVVAV